MKPVPAPELPALGLVIPDLIQLSFFVKGPVIVDPLLIETDETDRARRYFSSRPDASFSDDEQDRQGIGFIWKQDELSLKLYIKKSFSMSARFNLQRLAAARCGLPGANERHGNTVLPLLVEGYDLASLRRGMCQDIIDLTQKAKSIYVDICSKAFGWSIQSEVYANLSFIELAVDCPGDAELIKSYRRAFGKVVGL